MDKFFVFLVFLVHCVQRSPAYSVWGTTPWSMRKDYVANGPLTSIRVWYGVHTQHANFLHG